MFKGDEKDANKRYVKYSTWRDKITLKWKQDYFLFPTELSKILYVASYLEGDVYLAISEDVKHLMKYEDNTAVWKWDSGQALLEALDGKYLTVDVKA